MADLLSAAGDALAQIVALERRADEVHVAATQTRAAATTQTQALDATEGQLFPRLEASTRLLTELDKRMTEAGERTRGRISQQIATIEQQSADTAARHKLTRGRLAALRTELAKISAEVESLHKQTEHELQTIRAENTVLLASTVSALNLTEEVLTTTIKPGILGLRDAVDGRARQFLDHIHQEVLGRLDSDTRSFSDRMLKLAERLALVMTQSRGRTTENTKETLVKFNKASETNWRGGAGASVDGGATERSTQINTLGGQKRDAVNKLADHLRTTADGFLASVQVAESRYQQVHALPGKVNSILAKYSV